MSNDLTTREQFPAPLFTPTPQAAKRMLEFFTAQINNPHTRRAYLNASRRFAAWCQDHQIRQLSEVQPVHVAAFIQDLQGQLSPATVKQHLAALRILFDWLVTGHILQLNPAHAVRGPKYSLKKGKTPVLTATEARALLDSIRTVQLGRFTTDRLMTVLNKLSQHVDVQIDVHPRGADAEASPHP